MDPSLWKRAAAPAQDQYAPRSDKADCNVNMVKDYTYTGHNLAACNFPLGLLTVLYLMPISDILRYNTYFFTGGFGSGHVILQGDGTLQKWCVVNQVLQNYTITIELHCTCIFVFYHTIFCMEGSHGIQALARHSLHLLRHFWCGRGR